MVVCRLIVVIYKVFVVMCRVIVIVIVVIYRVFGVSDSWVFVVIQRVLLVIHSS